MCTVTFASVSEASEEEEEVEMSDDQRNSLIEEIKSMFAELSKDAKTEFESLKSKNEKLEVELAKAKAKVEELDVKLKAEPAQEPVKHIDKEVKLSENPSLHERLAHIKSKF